MTFGERLKELRDGRGMTQNAIIATSGILRPNLHPYDLRHMYMIFI